MKKIFFTLIILSFGIQSQAQTAAGSSSFPTKVAMDAFVPDLTDDQTPFAYVTATGANNGGYEWDVAGSAWVRPKAVADWATVANIPAGFADNTDDVDDADADAANELVTTFAVNGVNLELIDAGGTKTIPLATLGTDDQTATEVPVTATGFAGNLSATDTDIQTALATIDGLALGTDTQDLGTGSNGITLINGGSITTDNIIKQLKGPFQTSALAKAGGVADGEYFTVTETNPYNKHEGDKHKCKCP